jgi:GNAT superfamily N-acetyltransferase
MVLTKKIIYSSDTGKYTFKQIQQLSKQSEDFFETRKDPEQMQITPNNTKWIYAKHPDWVNIATQGGEFVGGAFCFPITKKSAKEFAQGNISEKELFKEAKAGVINLEAIYFCSVLVMPKYRGQKIGNALVKKLLIKMVGGIQKPILITYENYSKRRRTILTVKQFLKQENIFSQF